MVEEGGEWKVLVMWAAVLHCWIKAEGWQMWGCGWLVVLRQVGYRLSVVVEATDEHHQSRSGHCSTKEHRPTRVLTHFV